MGKILTSEHRLLGSLLVGGGALTKGGVQGHRAGRGLGSAQSLCPSVVRKSLEAGGL